MLIKNFVLLIT